MLLHDLVASSERIAGASGRLEKIGELAAPARQVRVGLDQPREVLVAVDRAEGEHDEDAHRWVGELDPGLLAEPGDVNKTSLIILIYWGKKVMFAIKLQCRLL